MVEVKKTTIWLRKKDAEKPIDGRIKNQGVIMIENKIILIEDDKEIRGMINDYLSGEFEVTAFNDGMSAIQKITSYDEYALALIDLMLPDITNFSVLDKEFIHIYDSDISGKALSKAIIENGIGLESMGRKQDTLEDFFFQLTEEEK